MTADAAPVRDVLASARRGEPCTLVRFGSPSLPVPVGRWWGDADDSDRALLARCTPATLDLGCGPGRMAEQLVRDGIPVLGVDTSAEAVTRARGRGVHVLRQDLFSPLPAEGSWGTALLADGNIGIGGDPVRLLDRVRRLLRPGGRVVVDLAPPGSGLSAGLVRLRAGDRTSRRFPWAVVGAEAAAGVAAAAGLRCTELTESDGRWFAVLEHGVVARSCLS